MKKVYIIGITIFIILSIIFIIDTNFSAASLCGIIIVLIITRQIDDDIIQMKNIIIQQQKEEINYLTYRKTN